MADNNSPDITTLTVQLVSAFVSNNTVASDDLAGLIQSTRAALTNELNPAPVEPEKPTYTPAVSVRKSLSSPDHIISLVDGKPYKTLKRHLASHGLSPEEYRSRYNLPKSYPLVATSYSDARRAVAAKIGLGRKPVTSTDSVAKAEPAVTAAPSAPAKAKAPARPVPAKKIASGDVDAKQAKAAAPAAATAAASSAPAAVKVAPAADHKAAPAKGDSRKRLSIAAPKSEKPGAEAETAAKPEVKDAAPKVKAAPKPTAASKAVKPAAAAAEKKSKKLAKAAAPEAATPAVNGDAKPEADTPLTNA